MKCYSWRITGKKTNVLILKLISTSESSIKKDFLLMLIITYIVASEMKSVNDKQLSLYTWER